jgi:hypothetical protein
MSQREATSAQQEMTMITKKSLPGIMLACIAMLVGLPTHAADLKSPDQVKNALRILAYVQDDMSRKLPTKRYDRLPHENEEFQEAAVPMRESVAGEPAEFNAKVEALLSKALAAANNVAEVSKTNDEEKITAAVTAVAAALKPLNELFPVKLRPVSGQLGAGPGKKVGGPPPDLR